jgi:methyl-accepting chemotaxis protein
MEPEQIEPYFKRIVESNKDIWSHFLIANRDGVEIVHSEGQEHYGKNISQKEYFKEPFNTGEVVIAEPTFSTSTGRKIMGIGYPLKVEGQIKGVLAGFIRLSYLTDIVNNKTNNQVSENSYSLILNSNGRVAAHPDSDKVLARNWLQPSQDSKVDTQASTEEIENMSEGFREVVQQMTDGKTGFKITNVDGERSIVAYQPLGISKMSIATVIPTDDAFSVLIKITNFLKLGVAILTVIFILVIYFMLKAIIGPIKEASEFAEQIANGNLDIDNLEQNYDDELGVLITSLNKMKDNLRHDIKNLVDNAAEVVEDLTAYSEELSASAEEGNATIETTNNLVEDISASIEQISASTEEVSSFAGESTSKTELGTENIAETLDNINQISQSTNQAVDIIEELDETAHEIEGIVGMITNISEQTNLLALNAAIEAARAGEAGEGFAVVADEIRDLAEETNDATDKVKNLISKTQKKADNGLVAIKKADKRATTGKEVVKETETVFSEIKDASQQTASQIEQTANATQNLAEKSEQVRTSTDNIKNMSAEITESSQELAEMSQKLQEIIGQFDL